MPVFKLNGTWHYAFQVNKVRYRRAIPGAKSKWDAEQAEAQAKREVFLGVYGKVAGNTRFDEYAEKDYMAWARDSKRSWKSDKYHVRVLAAFFKEKRFREITPLLVEKFKRARQSTPAGSGRYKRSRKPASINREIACLSRIFSLAMRDGYAQINPCLQVSKLREPNQRNRYITPEEEERLLTACVGERDHLRGIVLVALHTGMRRGEIFDLQKRDVDFFRGQIHILQSKTDKDRYVPLNDVTKEILEPIYKRKKRDDAYLFASPKAEGKRLVTIKKAFAGACREAGIEDLHFHDLRHTFATRLADAGVDPFTLAEILGHSDLRMTKRYTHATEARKRQALNGLARKTAT